MDDTPLAAATPSASDQIGPYRIVQVLGRGSIEIRCLARDLRRRRDVVLEVLPLVMSRQREVVERLAHLADVVRQLRHPGLVRLLRFEVDRERPELAYLVWQHTPGRTLAELIAESDGGLPFERVGAWAAQLAEAVDYLDDNGPGHGGVRPENVLIDADDRAHLAGAVTWREVRRLYARTTGRPIPGGEETPAGGEIDRRRDIRGLATTVYAALRGADGLDADASGPEPIAGLSAHLNMALMAALDDDGCDQFTCASDLVRSLEGAPLREMLIPRPGRRSRRAASPLLTGVATTTLTLSAVIWLWQLMPVVTGPGVLHGLRSIVRPLSVLGDRSAAVRPAPLARPERPAAPILAAVPEPESEPERPPVAAAPVVTDAELDGAEQLALDNRLLARPAERARRPGIDRIVADAQAMLEEGRRARRDGRRADARVAYLAAAEGFARARLDAALSATVAQLGTAVRAELDAIARTADGRLDAASGSVATMIQAGDEAYRRGDLAEANVRWRAAHDALVSLRPLADLVDAALQARERWQRSAALAPVDWAEPLRPLAAQARENATRAAALLERNAYEHALAAWDGAAGRQESLLIAQHAAACEVEELAAAWTALRASTPSQPPPGPEAIDRREAAERVALEADAARSCGALDAARTAYAEAAALWHESVQMQVAAVAAHGETLDNSIGQRLVYVDGGTVLMGSPAGEPGRDPAETPREIRLERGFWIAATEITRGQFGAFVEATGYRTDAERRGWSHGLRPDGRWRRVNGLDWRDPGFAQDDEHPVVCVSYNDARAFCAWLGEREGRRYRLPREAEWEHACRGGAASAFHWGDEPSAGAGFENAADATWSDRFDETDAFPWTDGCLYTCPVGSLRANPWGLFDVHGNVQEWCLDPYDPAAAASVDLVDESPRVIRGGSFAAAPRRCRAAHRDASTPATSFATLGFRVVLESR
jgi:formylglycine-generating enzyme required for sulfatase activity